VNLRFNADSICVATGQRLGNAAAWLCSTRLMVQPPKPPPVSRAPISPGNCRANSTNRVGLRTTALEVLAVAPVRLGHQATEFGESLAANASAAA